ncbi:MAG: hypothetical protein ABI026_10460 [Gemmatimonadaceae bacterium]
MSSVNDMKPFETPDGTRWGVEVQLPGASSVNIVFHHPDPSTSRKDRYARLRWRGPEASDVTARLSVAKVRAALSDVIMADLFQRSMPIGFGAPAFATA